MSNPSDFSLHNFTGTCCLVSTYHLPLGLYPLCSLSSSPSLPIWNAQFTTLNFCFYYSFSYSEPHNGFVAFNSWTQPNFLSLISSSSNMNFPEQPGKSTLSYWNLLVCHCLKPFGDYADSTSSRYYITTTASVVYSDLACL